MQQTGAGKGFENQDAPFGAPGKEVTPDPALFAGVWKWKLAADNQAISSRRAVRTGVLFFRKSESRDVVGISAIETAATDKAGRPHSIISNLQLRGSIATDGRNNPKIKFVVKSNGVRTTSSAVLSDDRQTLRGTSETTVQGTNGAETLRHAWEAERIK